MYLLYLTIIRFQMLYDTVYPQKQMNNIGPAYCKSRDGGKPLQHAVKSSRMRDEYNVQVGCFLFHSDMNLIIYSSWLPSSVHYHLPLLLHTTKPWIHKHLCEVATDPKQADQRAPRTIHHSLAHSQKADTCLSTATLPMNPPTIWPRMHIQTSSVRPEAVRTRCST